MIIDFQSLEVGNHRIGCPDCGRGGRDKTLGITISGDGKGVAHCFRCEFTESNQPQSAARHLRIVKATERDADPQKSSGLSQYGRDLFDACKPVSGEAAAYLTARNCVIPPKNSDLRCHSALKHPGGYVGPCLVALITDALTNEPLSLHRTWIRPDGTKADVEPPRLLLAKHRKAGGVIRLWPDDAVSTGLGIAEGIETALSMAHGFTPVWSCVDAGNLASFPVLAGIESLLISADHDMAGLKAARECATRWALAGKSVHVIEPDRERTDLNDLALEAA